ncbi:unnamed protein product [Prunus armeniaca]
MDNICVRTGWNIEKLLQALLPKAVKKIISIHVDFEGNLPFTCIWGPTSNGTFSCKVYYELSIGSSWNFIWKLKIPPRVKVFIWLLTQKKILTNVQRTIVEYLLEWDKANNLLKKEGFYANLGHGEVFMVEAWAISKGRPNFAAVFLAKMGHHKDLDYHELFSPPEQLKAIFDDDKKECPLDA